MSNDILLVPLYKLIIILILKIMNQDFKTKLKTIKDALKDNTSIVINEGSIWEPYILLPIFSSGKKKVNNYELIVRDELLNINKLIVAEDNIKINSTHIRVNKVLNTIFNSNQSKLKLEECMNKFYPQLKSIEELKVVATLPDIKE
jgi:hypothetical protein